MRSLDEYPNLIDVDYAIDYYIDSFRIPVKRVLSEEEKDEING